MPQDNHHRNFTEVSLTKDTLFLLLPALQSRDQCTEIVNQHDALWWGSETKSHCRLNCGTEIGGRCTLRHDGEGVLLSLLSENKLLLKFKSSWNREKEVVRSMVSLQAFKTILICSSENTTFGTRSAMKVTTKLGLKQSIIILHVSFIFHNQKTGKLNANVIQILTSESFKPQITLISAISSEM